jgi:hypothetical protein
VIGFAPYPWAQSLTDLSAAARMVRKAKSEANLVIVVMHAGAEGVDHQHVRPGTEWFLGENRGDSEDFSHAVIDAGASLVLGSGPHVLRGMEWHHGRLIAYSLGNFLGDGTLSIGGILGDSAILHVHLGRERRLGAREPRPGGPRVAGGAGGGERRPVGGDRADALPAGLRSQRDARHGRWTAAPARLANRLKEPVPPAREGHVPDRLSRACPNVPVARPEGGIRSRLAPGTDRSRPATSQ